MRVLFWGTPDFAVPSGSTASRRAFHPNSRPLRSIWARKRGRAETVETPGAASHAPANWPVKVWRPHRSRTSVPSTRLYWLDDTVRSV